MSLISCFRFEITPQAAQYHSRTEYQKETARHQLTSSIIIDGQVLLQNGSQTLLVNNKLETKNIPIKVWLTSGEPILINNPTEQQTRPVSGGVNRELIKQSIGQITYLHNSIDEDGTREGARIIADLFVPASMFVDLKSWVRDDVCRIQSISILGFGENMQFAPGYGNMSYNLDLPPDPDIDPPTLNIASFSFLARRENTQA